MESISISPYYHGTQNIILQLVTVHVCGLTEGYQLLDSNW